METILKMILSTLQLMNRNLCHLAEGETLEQNDHPPAGPANSQEPPSEAERIVWQSERIAILERLISRQGDELAELRGQITRLRARLDQVQEHATQRSQWTDDAISAKVHEGEQAIADLQRARLT